MCRSIAAWAKEVGKAKLEVEDVDIQPIVDSIQARALQIACVYVNIFIVIVCCYLLITSCIYCYTACVSAADQAQFGCATSLFSTVTLGFRYVLCSDDIW